jgi:hypothetical protein
MDSRLRGNAGTCAGGLLSGREANFRFHHHVIPVKAGKVRLSRVARRVREIDLPFFPQWHAPHPRLVTTQRKSAEAPWLPRFGVVSRKTG